MFALHIATQSLIPAWLKFLLAPTKLIPEHKARVKLWAEPVRCVHPKQSINANYINTWMLIDKVCMCIWSDQIKHVNTLKFKNNFIEIWIRNYGNQLNKYSSNTNYLWPKILYRGLTCFPCLWLPPGSIPRTVYSPLSIVKSYIWLQSSELT